MNKPSGVTGRLQQRLRGNLSRIKPPEAQSARPLPLSRAARVLQLRRGAQAMQRYRGLVDGYMARSPTRHQLMGPQFRNLLMLRQGRLY